MEQELLYDIALTRLYMVGPRSARTLISCLGSAKAVFEADKNDLLAIGNVGKYISDSTYRHTALERARQELDFIERHDIKVITSSSPEFPSRLNQCPDAPTVLYYWGNGSLQARKVVAVVGTRRVSNYGRDITEHLIADLARMLPDVMVVSGLAYGVDITAHRAALLSNIPTVGVVAHGLDTLYPLSHKRTAEQMAASQGGVLTEYLSHTKPDPQNFVRRNRIIAGLADVTVIVESALKGGSLLTAQLANDYNRDVMAFPGRVSDELSAGCNSLIRQNKAQLITSASDLVELMGWEHTDAMAVQQSLFDDVLPPEQQKVIDFLKDEPQHINVIAQAVGLPIQHTSALLTNMVFDDLIRQLPGDRYVAVTAHVR